VQRTLICVRKTGSTSQFYALPQSDSTQYVVNCPEKGGGMFFLIAPQSRVCDTEETGYTLVVVEACHSRHQLHRGTDCLRLHSAAKLLRRTVTVSILAVSRCCWGLLRTTISGRWKITPPVTDAEHGSEFRATSMHARRKLEWWERQQTLHRRRVNNFFLENRSTLTCQSWWLTDAPDRWTAEVVLSSAMPCLCMHVDAGWHSMVLAKSCSPFRWPFSRSWIACCMLACCDLNVLPKCSFHKLDRSGLPQAVDVHRQPEAVAS